MVFPPKRTSKLNCPAGRFGVLLEKKNRSTLTILAETPGWIIQFVKNGTAEPSTVPHASEALANGGGITLGYLRLRYKRKSC